MGIGENITKVKNELPGKVKLIAVSKTKPVEIIMDAYHAGHRIFGENKVQELAIKYVELPKDIEWHMIGHLQTNKVKYIAPFVELIHGVDSLKLLKVINKEAVKNNRIISCLLQFYIGTESTKFGLSLEEAKSILDSNEFFDLKNIRIRGVMGMATFTDDMELVRNEFRSLKETFDYLKNKFFSNDKYFSEISMGMSDDYPIAIEEGSTMVRIGSKIFGIRNYS